MVDDQIHWNGVSSQGQVNNHVSQFIRIILPRSSTKLVVVFLPWQTDHATEFAVYDCRKAGMRHRGVFRDWRDRGENSTAARSGVLST